ncbi:MAG: hypothetical protein BJ554DRAFT_4676, partial [Olpidium bornovanus]
MRDSSRAFFVHDSDTGAAVSRMAKTAPAAHRARAYRGLEIDLVENSGGSEKERKRHPTHLEETPGNQGNPKKKTGKPVEKRAYIVEIDLVENSGGKRLGKGVGDVVGGPHGQPAPALEESVVRKEKQILAFLRGVLEKDPATEWRYLREEGKVATLTLAWRHLESRFGRKKQDSIALRRLLDIEWKEDDTVHSRHDRIRRRAREALERPDAPLVKDVFIGARRPLKLRIRVEDAEPKTLDEAYTVAKRVIDTMRRAQRACERDQLRCKSGHSRSHLDDVASSSASESTLSEADSPHRRHHTREAPSRTKEKVPQAKTQTKPSSVDPAIEAVTAALARMTLPIQQWMEQIHTQAQDIDQLRQALCYLVEQERHCQQRTRFNREGEGGVICFNCGEAGHLSLECTKPHAAQPNPSTGTGVVGDPQSLLFSATEIGSHDLTLAAREHEDPVGMVTDEKSIEGDSFAVKRKLRELLNEAEVVLRLPAKRGRRPARSIEFDLTPETIPTPISAANPPGVQEELDCVLRDPESEQLSSEHPARPRPRERPSERITPLRINDGETFDIIAQIRKLTVTMPLMRFLENSPSEHRWFLHLLQKERRGPPAIPAADYLEPNPPVAVTLFSAEDVISAYTRTEEIRRSCVDAYGTTHGATTPVLVVTVNDVPALAGVDDGSDGSFVHPNFVQAGRPPVDTATRKTYRGMEGGEVRTAGTVSVTLRVGFEGQTLRQLPLFEGAWKLEAMSTIAYGWGHLPRGWPLQLQQLRDAMAWNLYPYVNWGAIVRDAFAFCLCLLHCFCRRRQLLTMPSPRRRRRKGATPLPLSPHVTATRAAPPQTAMAPSNPSNSAVRSAASSPAPVDPAAVPIPPSPSLDARMDLPPLRVPLFIPEQAAPDATPAATPAATAAPSARIGLEASCQNPASAPAVDALLRQQKLAGLAEWRASIVARVGVERYLRFARRAPHRDGCLVPCVEPLPVASPGEPRPHGCSTRGPIDDRSPVDRNRAYSVAFAPRSVVIVLRRTAAAAADDRPPRRLKARPNRRLPIRRRIARRPRPPAVSLVVLRRPAFPVSSLTAAESACLPCGTMHSSVEVDGSRGSSASFPKLELSGTFTEAQKLAELRNNVVPELCSFLNWDMERHRPLSTLQEDLDVLANLYASSYALNQTQIFASKVAQLRQEPAESMAAYLAKANALCIEYAAESNLRP